jgi:hypothetical protein
LILTLAIAKLIAFVRYAPPRRRFSSSFLFLVFFGPHAATNG